MAARIPNASTTYRRLQFFAAGLVLLYAFLVLAFTWSSADLGFTMIQGQRVAFVEPNTPAHDAGVRAGDIIQSIDGDDVTTQLARARGVWSFAPGDLVTLGLSRGDTALEVSFAMGRRQPLSSIAGLVLAVLLLGLALVADRGAVAGHPKTFFRATLVYVAFMCGAFSLDVINQSLALYAVWAMAVSWAAPVTCHQMLQFPLGPTQLSKRVLWLLYGPSTLLGILFVAGQFLFLSNLWPAIAGVVPLAGAPLIGIGSAAYLLVGAVSRIRRLRANPDFDKGASRWLKVGSACMVLPMIVGGAQAVANPTYFVTVGFKPLAAITIVGGVFSVAMAMSRVSVGQLDVFWRRSGGYLLATGLAVGGYLAVVAVLGGGASAATGGDFRSVLLATLVASALFGPMRLRLQRAVDERFGRDRARARRLLREAAEEAGATLDIRALERGLVLRVKEALRARGALLYVETDEVGGWVRAARAGESTLPRTLSPKEPLAQKIMLALRSGGTVESETGAVVSPIAISDGEPAALCVVPAEGTRLDDEARDLLYTAGANFAVAIGNARAHTRVRELNQRLKQEVELAETRRQEIARLKERVEAENRELIGQLAARTGRSPVIGQGLKTTFELVQKVARSETSVLVRGETGVGKELVARALHAASTRRDGPFVVVDCGAISPGLFESALFGHVRGAFTGAVRDAQGAFRSANGGTIFLDEIGELPADLQPKLLRVLQERDVHPVGGDKREPVNVRVVAGTNRDLAKEVELGAFRQDLLYRLRVVEVVVPPLRERLGDIEALAEHFLSAAAEKGGRMPKRLAPDALATLLEYEWPGNVRELEHTIEAAQVYSDGEFIHASDLPIFDQVFQQRGRQAMRPTRALGSEGGGAPRAGLREALSLLERERLEQALDQHSGNKTQTAKSLGISRGALLRRLKRYGLM